MTAISPISSDHHGIHDSWSTQPLAVSVPPDALPYPGSARVNIHRLARSVDYFLAMLLVLFALLNAGDLLTTYLGLAHGLNEGNPLMNELLAHYGFGALIADKLLVITAVTSGSLLLHKLNWRIAHAIALVCNTLILLVVLSNIVQFLMIK
jgi:hypothetical protein